MTLYDFIKLNPNAGRDYLQTHGILVSNTVDADTVSAFYSLHDFYVEVVVAIDFSAIVRLAPFNKGERYERMIAAMEVPEI